MYKRQTYAHKDIAFEFGSAISPVFKLYLLKEYQRLKDAENDRLKLEWSAKRFLSKNNYLIHTDAVKNYVLPQSNYTKNTEWLAYADEADLLNVALDVYKRQALNKQPVQPQMQAMGAAREILGR